MSYKTLNKKNIESVLISNNTALQSLAVLESVDSTNDWCLQQCKNNKPVPFACVAETQTNGKGRRGKKWVSSVGESIIISFATQLNLAPNKLGMLSLAVGMAIVDVLRNAGIRTAMLKWPNDVIVNQQKIAGILIETLMVNGRLNIVVGLGVNFNMSSNLSEDIQTPWTDVFRCMGEKLSSDRTFLIGHLLGACLSSCEHYEQDYKKMSIEFDANYNAYINKAVTVLIENGEDIKGMCVGTTSNGELRVLVNQTERVFNSAEISLRKAATC